MGLEYKLAKQNKIEELQELINELAPRNNCRNYIKENGGKAELLEKKEFDSYYKDKSFIDGPFKEGFGDGDGEPYNPNRQAFGKLKNKKIVYCELSKGNQEKVTILLKRTKVD